jgi:arylsulfatase A-like enzyme/Flp pilus assembly protein TadD
MKRVLIYAAVCLTLLLIFCGSGAEADTASMSRAASGVPETAPGAAAASTAGPAGGPAGASKVPRKSFENILLITIDTWRHDRFGLHTASHVQTPHLDALASRGTVFTNAYSHNPVTLPAHVNILLGTTALYHGIGDNTGFVLEEHFVTMAEYLKEVGFETSAFIGAFPLDSRFGLGQGFDLYDDNYGTHNQREFFFIERNAEAVIQPAIRWISSQQRRWFSWIHLFDPHQPYLPPAPYDQKYPDDQYSGEVAYVDHQLGVLFKYLEEHNQMDRTLIIVTGDHGEALGEKGEQTHAYFAYNNTILIPLFIYIPGAGAATVSENVCHADIFPTVCDLLNEKPLAHFQGESLLPIMEGKKRRERDIYFESLTPYLNRGWAPLRGFVRENTKFIDLPIREVYDLAADAGEDANLAESSDLKRLRADLMRLRKSLEGERRTSRSSRIDSDTQKKLKTLGYMSNVSTRRKKVFSEEDDLKTLLPLQNRMLDALASYQGGAVDPALTELKAVVKSSPTFVLVYRHMGTILQAEGRVEEAVAILREGLEKNPDSVNLMSKLGITLTEAGQADEAISLLEKSVLIMDYDPEIFNYLGVAYYRKGRFQEALKNYNRVLELDSNYAPAHNNLGSLHLSVYQRGKDERAYQAAMDHFNKALEIDPRLFSALNGRASAHYFKNRVRQAQEDWARAIQVNPDFADPYFNIGISFLRSGDKASALQYFNLCRERLYHKLPSADQQRLNRLIRQASY